MLSYFIFLRWLFLLNILIFFLVLVFIFIPQVIYRPSIEYGNLTSFHGTDLLDGRVSMCIKNPFLQNTNQALVTLPDMNKFCDWLSETEVISVHDSFF